MTTNVKPQAEETAFEVGMTVTVTNLVSANPKWGYLVAPRNRRVGATGKIVGFYRIPDMTLLSVTHDDDSGTYQSDEVERSA
jgi:hypothetical protein